MVIDISASGILVKNDEELEANAPVVFEFSGTTGAVLVLAVLPGRAASPRAAS